MLWAPNLGLRAAPVLCFLCWLPFHLGAYAGNFQFRASGDITYVTTRVSLPAETIQNYSFEVCVLNCASRLSTTNSQKSAAFELSCESGVQYRLWTILDASTAAGLIVNRTGKGSVTITNKYVAEVEYGEVPPDDGTTLNYLWLAYGSRCYFAGLTTNRLRPIWALDDPALRSDGFTVPGFWKLDPDGGLPAEVVYMNDGFCRARDSAGKPVVFKWQAPFDQGFTNAAFTVVAATNVGGIMVPLEWNFVRYGIRSEQFGGYQLSKITETRGRVTTFSVDPVQGPLLPSFSGVAKVSDFSFSGSNYAVPLLEYAVTNGVWPSTEDRFRVYSNAARLQAKLDRLAAEGTRKLSIARPIVWSLMLLLCLPGIVALRRVARGWKSWR